MAVDRERILQTAQRLVDRKKYDKAIVEYQKITADDPSDVRTLLKIGDLYLKLDDFERAIEVYEQVGEYYYREGFSVKAIAVYKQIRGIIRKHAQHLEGRYGHIVPRLAEIYTQLGLTSDALAAYDEVASRLRREGRERDALDIFKKVVELDPQNPIAHLRVADSRARLGEIDKAVERFGEAARIMVKLGRQDDALKVIERLLEYRQDPAYARMAGQLYLERNNPNDPMAALTKLQIAFKANPKDLETLGALAAAFDKINQPKKAVEVLKESARVAKESNQKAAFEQLMTVLQQRAPDDPAVQQLRLPKMRPKQQTEAEIEVSAVAEEMALDTVESMEEVFELDDRDIHAVSVSTADSSMFAPEAAGHSGARRLMDEAERVRNSGRIDQAINLLRDGIRNLPSSHLLRHKLSDLLLEAGDTLGSIAEKLILAQELANEGRIEPAVEMLDEVLLLQADQPDALEMRANLGFPMLPEQGIDDIQLDSPLQSYDIESGGVEEVLHRSRQHSAPHITLDDPFIGADPRQAAMHAQRGLPPPSRRGRPPPPPPSSTAPGRQHLDEEALDRAESLAEQGRYDEARAVLHQQLRMLPNHPLVLERLADIDTAAAARRPSHSGPYPLVPSSPPSRPIPLSDPPPAGPYVRPPPPRPVLGSELDPVLEQVRAGVRHQVSDADSATHYDLGVAYLEMGLHSDAISELTLAARDPKRELICLSMIAGIHRDHLNDYDAALDALHRALAATHRTRDQEVQLGYEIADTYEQKQMPEKALHYFEWLAKTDPSYDDQRGSVQERIQRLRTESGAQRRPQAPAATPDAGEVEDAFDDLFGKKSK